jgi:hypothetical protein
MPNGNTNEWSNGRVRNITRADEVKAPETPPSPASHKAQTAAMKTSGRDFAPGNQAWRIGQLKRRAEGLATLNPAKVPTWMRPHVEHGAPYIAALLGMLEDKPALHPLAGDCADAHCMYRGLMALALAAEDAKTRAALMSEARGWLREHRTALATLCSLAGGLQLPEAKGFVATVNAALDKKGSGDAG